MSNAVVKATSTATSRGRRGFAIAVGVAIFVVSIMSFGLLIKALFGDEHAPDGSHTFAWAVGGAVCAGISYACTKLVAWDFDHEIFYCSAVGALVVLAIAIFAGHGFGSIGGIDAMFFLIGGYAGVRFAAKP